MHFPSSSGSWPAHRPGGVGPLVAADGDLRPVPGPSEGAYVRCMSAPGPAEPVDLAGGAAANSQVCAVRYAGPAAPLAALTRLLRDGDVTLASVYVEAARDPTRVARVGECERLALSLLCRGSRASLESVIRCFVRSFGPQVRLRIE